MVLNLANAKRPLLLYYDLAKVPAFYMGKKKLDYLIFLKVLSFC